MADMRSKIDEMIEESYLATLPEEKIRQDVLQYLDSCYRCAEEMGLDPKVHQEVIRRLDVFGNLAMRIDQAEELLDRSETGGVDDDDLHMTEQEDLAHRAARFKLLVIDGLRGVNRALAREVERRRFPDTVNHREPIISVAPRPRMRPAPMSAGGVKLTFLRVLYAAVAGATLFIIGYRIFGP
jgi:hypothetical protein